MNLDINPLFVREISVRFKDAGPEYSVLVSNDGSGHPYMAGLWFPITRAQMLNIIDDVAEAKRNA